VQYSAPEQLATPPGEVGPWTDVWALALVMLEVLSGAPIPDPDLKPSPMRENHNGPWCLYYSGLCGGLYQPLLQELINAVATDHRFALHVSGSDSQSLAIPAKVERIRHSGFLNGLAWQEAFDGSDALLVVLSFEPRHRRHLATHFPSKLVEYANRGRPILIWGPPWSSAVKWGMAQSKVLCLSHLSASDLLKSADQWLKGQAGETPPIAGLQASEIAYQFNQAVSRLLQSPNNKLT
jgi:hypothetical protein